MVPARWKATRRASARAFVLLVPIAASALLAPGLASAQSAAAGPALPAALAASPVPASSAGQAGAADPTAPRPQEPRAAGRPFLDGRFMVGVSGSHVLTPDSDLGQKWSVSPVFRPTPRRNGWSPAIGLNWYDGDITVDVGGQPTIVGRLRLRPVMAGIGYSFGVGRTRTTLSLVGGYAFNSATSETNLPDGASAAVSVTDAWAVRPSINLTYALTRRLAIISSVGYVYMHPTIRVDVNDHGNRALLVLDDYRSDYVNFTIGTAFSIF